jgi:type IV secretion system protein VirB11
VANRKNILISGGTSSGKTTFLNACLKEIPLHERIITIEDAREVHPPHPNRLHLLASRGDQGRAKVTTQQLLEASLRLRPDRIILGEIRGTECVTYWSAINSGHPGSLTSIHADTPQLAFEKLVMLGMQTGLGFTRDHIVDYLRHTVDLVVQLRRDADGRRFISDVWNVSAPLH